MTLAPYGAHIPPRSPFVSFGKKGRASCYVAHFMMAPSLLDAYDTVSQSEVMLRRLQGALAELEPRGDLKEEKGWLSTAIERVTAARAGVEPVVSRAMRLADLAPLRAEHGRTMQQAAVDSIERLQAGIAFHAGPRAPLLEALFGKLKLPVLRRADKEDFEKFCTDFEKRLSSTYAKRMLAENGLSPVQTAADQLRSAFKAWREAFSGEPLPQSEADQLREQLGAFADALELPMRQARLLAEAALAPVDELFQQSGLAQRPRKRKLASSEDGAESAE